MSKPFTIYGSGDAGTKELRAIFSARTVSHAFADIRKPAPKGQPDPLKLLAQHRLYTVPQVFDENGNHIGNFEQTVRYLDNLRAA